MEFIQNPQIQKELFDRLRKKYLTNKPHPHLTELLYCLTRGWYDKHDPLAPSDKELLYFAIGFGMEEVLLRFPDEVAPKSQVMDGISLTLDYIDLQGAGLDLKSTRMGIDPNTGIPKKGWPEFWLKQFMGYAKLIGQNTFGVAIISLIQPGLHCGTFIFTNEEIEANWEWVLSRKMQYSTFIDSPPTPFVYNEEWECKNCRYWLRCGAISQGKMGYVDGEQVILRG